jgi:hypothetical protein
MSNYIITTIDPDYSSQSIEPSGSSQQSTAIITGSGLIRLATTVHCHIRFGVNPTATENDLMLPANHVEVFSFKSGEKIAVIKQGGGSGELNITVID